MYIEYIETMAQELKFHEDVMSLTADCKDNLIVTGYENGYLNIWDLRNVKNEPILQGCFSEKGDVGSAIFTRVGQHTVHVATGRFIHTLDMRKMDEKSWTGPQFECEDDVNQIVISDNDQLLAAADDNHNVSLFDLKKCCLVSRLSRHKSCVSSVQFCPSKQRQLISGGYDCMLFQWDVFKGRNLCSVNVSNLDDPEWNLPKSFNPAYVLTCDVDSVASEEIIVAGSENGNLHLFRWEKKLNHIKTFHAHDQAVTQAKHYPNHNQPVIFTGSNDMKIKIWPLTPLINGETICEPLRLTDHNSKINWLAFNETNLIICDTSPNVTLQPIDI